MVFTNRTETITLLKLLSTAILLVGFTSSAWGQTGESRGEFFAGYSLLRTDVETDDFSNPLTTNDEPFKNLNGFNVAATGYFTGRVGITADFSAHFKSESLDTGVEGKARTFNFLGGPQVRFTNSTRVTPFVRALAGVQNNRLRVNGLTNATGGAITDFEDSQTDFALALGGGLDVRVSPRVAIRVFQIDYNPTFQRERDVTFAGMTSRVDGSRTDNVRFSVGIVFK